MTYKWNEKKSRIRFWDSDQTTPKEGFDVKSDKEFLDDPYHESIQDTILVLCSVVRELIEIEENRK